MSDLKVEAVRKELHTLRSIARFAMPAFMVDIDAALKALPKLEKTRALARRVLMGGSELAHYPALKELGEAP